jgi:hypothetical protein
MTHNYFSAVFMGTLIILVFIVFISMAFMLYQVVPIGVDALSTRSLGCKNVIVNDTTIVIVDGYASLYIVTDTTSRQLLDIVNPDIVSRWKRLNHGDIISARLGKQTVAFCKVGEEGGEK